MIAAIALGVVQALTEFLPVSSSAHLLIVPWLFGFANPGLGFDAALHIGTSVALVWFFWGDFRELILTRSPLLKLILIASVPGGVVGFFGEKLIDAVFHQGDAAIAIAALGMLITTAIIGLIDRGATLKKDLGSLTRRDAIWIGVGQALALIPGVSRSGSTIAAGLFLGLKRDAAARFSFLIGTPIALGAGLYKTYGLVRDGGLAVGGLSSLVVGVVVSAGLGFVVIKWLLGYLQKHSLQTFLIYRAIFATGILVIFVMRGLRL